MVSTKVTVAHGLRYDYLTDTFGQEKVRLYADANRMALEEMATRVGEHNIDCDFTRAAAYTYAPSAKKQQKVENGWTQRSGSDSTLHTSRPFRHPWTWRRPSGTTTRSTNIQLTRPRCRFWRGRLRCSGGHYSARSKTGGSSPSLLPSSFGK